MLNNVAIAVFPDPEIDTPETIVFHDSEYAAITATGLYPAISGTSASANVPLFAAAEYFVVRVRDITIPDIKFPFFSYRPRALLNYSASCRFDSKNNFTTTKTPDLCQVKSFHINRFNYEARYILCSAFTLLRSTVQYIIVVLGLAWPASD